MKVFQPRCKKIFFSPVLKENKKNPFHRWCVFVCVCLGAAKPFTGDDVKYKLLTWMFNTWWLGHDLFYTKEQICRCQGKPPTEISILYPYFSSWRFILPSIKAQKTSFYSLVIFMHNETWDTVSRLHLCSAFVIAVCILPALHFSVRFQNFNVQTLWAMAGSRKKCNSGMSTL